jgi:hypothetical protein
MIQLALVTLKMSKARVAFARSSGDRACRATAARPIFKRFRPSSEQAAHAFSIAYSGVSVMTYVYFHCTNAEGTVRAPRGIEVEDFVEAHERAAQIVREFVSSIGLDDWRSWILHARDEDGEDIFLMPFSCSLGRLH